MDKIDFKSLSLELYDQEVIITLIKGTGSYNKYGKTIIGILTGRIWGEKFEQHKSLTTVIALTIRVGNEEIYIPCIEMEYLERAEGYQI